MKRFVLMLLVVGFGCGFLAACNTVEGFGKDVKKVGSEVEEHAKH